MELRRLKRPESHHDRTNCRFSSVTPIRVFITNSHDTPFLYDAHSVSSDSRGAKERNVECVTFLPFKIHCESELTEFRAETFWTKEPETLAWIGTMLSNSTERQQYFVDVGANIGIYSLFAAAKSPNCKILAIEPFEVNFAELIRNVALNGFEDRICCVHGALADFSGVRKLIVTDDRCGSTGATVVQDVQQFDQIRSTARHQDVRVFRGDELITDFIEVDRPGSILMKVDTDGDELSILHGVYNLLSANKIESILCETQLANQTEITTFLQNFQMIEDERFNDIIDHSTHRRTHLGKPERNVIYSRELIQKLPIRQKV